MVLSDSDPRKWTLKEHTKVKHELLDKYLTPWIYKLASANNSLLYIDGFAGKGEYFEGSEFVGIGSPVIAMRKVQDLKEKISKFYCLFIEKNKENYENLYKFIETEEKVCSHPIIVCRNGDFENEMIKFLDDQDDSLPPTFCFIDPFGFDAPFYVIKRLMAIPKTEIFFTFMSRDINRFVSSEKHFRALRDLFGSENWKDHIQLSGESYSREKSIVEFYRSQLIKEASVKYTMPFMVKMPDKDQTVYYLIHATNSFDGFKIMKDIMSGRSSSEVFGYLGPKDGQTSLGGFSLDQLKNYLLRTYSNQKISFDDIISQSYPVEEVIQFVEKNYRKILKEMEEQKIVTVRRITSKTNRGLSGNDMIVFPQL
jgi:three-Cys-motif partner protein